MGEQLCETREHEGDRERGKTRCDFEQVDRLPRPWISGNGPTVKVFKSVNKKNLHIVRQLRHLRTTGRRLSMGEEALSDGVIKVT